MRGVTKNPRMILLVCSVALLCLLPGSLCAPPTCDELVRPLAGMTPGQAAGSWAVLAASMTNASDEVLLGQRDSITFHAYDFTCVQANRFGDECKYYRLNVTLKDNVMTLKAMGINMAGTFYYTSCPDCLVFTFKVEGLDSTDLYLVSKRRELELSEKEEFAAQAKCLNLREPVWMDPTKALCERKLAEEVTVWGPDFITE
ncbi:uncharacterized protein LOC144020971 [Festucalex cinctus]